MDTKTVKLFAEYNGKTNQAMNRLVEGLAPEQWDHAFSGYYPTIHALCNHLYVSDVSWLKRFGNHRPFHYLEDPLFQVQLTLSSQVLADQRDYLAKRAILDGKIAALAGEVTDDDLAATLTYQNFRGVEQRRNLGGLILHMFNHGTHHRGMISLYLESLGIANDYSSLFHLV